MHVAILETADIENSTDHKLEDGNLALSKRRCSTDEPKDSRLPRA